MLGFDDVLVDGELGGFNAKIQATFVSNGKIPRHQCSSVAELVEVGHVVVVGCNTTDADGPELGVIVVIFVKAE